MKKNKMVIRKFTDIPTTVKEFKTYKKEFDKLTDYKVKLSYFFEKFKDFTLRYFTLYSPKCEKFEVTSEKDCITIYPQNAQEREVYFNWLTENNLDDNLHEMKLTFEEKLSKTPNKSLFLTRELTRIKKEISIFTGSSMNHNTKFHKSIYASFKEGYDSKVEVRKIDFSNENLFKENHNFHEVFRGCKMAEYEGFIDTYQLNITGKQQSKIKFNGTGSVFAFLMKELANKGYIEYPLINGENNFTGYGRMLLQHFEVESKESTVLQEFKLSSINLSEIKKIKFYIPELKDIK